MIAGTIFADRDMRHQRTTSARCTLGEFSRKLATLFYIENSDDLHAHQ